MAIKDLQRRLTQVGVIRLGEQRTAKSGKRFPAKLETFRFTSPSRPLIDAVAAAYGGEVRPWQSNTGPQWEVTTAVKEIPVLVPPQKIDPNYELWGNGFRARMCDGETEQIRNTACLCREQVRECKPTTRMSLMLADIPSLGTWKIESHGWNAAAELPMLAESIESAPQPIPARLEIQARQKKVFDPRKPQDKQVETRNYMVPVLHFDFLTPAQAFGGQIGAAARNALGAAPQQRQAIEPAASPLTAQRVVELAALARNVPQVQQLWKDAAAAGVEVLTVEVQEVLTARAGVLGAKPKPPPVKAGASESEPVPPVEVVEGDDDEPDQKALWMRIQALAGDRGWNAKALEDRITSMFNRASDEINGWQMEKFIAAVEAGEVQ